MATSQVYHYTESGLDNVCLTNGFEFVDRPGGCCLRIRDIDDLHEAIARQLIARKKHLPGKDVRFLRQELLMSQGILAKLLGMSRQTVIRRENGERDIPRPADVLIRLLFGAHIRCRQFSIPIPLDG